MWAPRDPRVLSLGVCTIKLNRPANTFTVTVSNPTTTSPRSGLWTRPVVPTGHLIGL